MPVFVNRVTSLVDNWIKSTEDLNKQVARFLLSIFVGTLVAIAVLYGIVSLLIWIPSLWWIVLSLAVMLFIRFLVWLFTNH